MNSLKAGAGAILVLLLASCALLPPSRSEAGFADKSKVPQAFRLGQVKTLNPLLPPVETTQMANLVAYLASANGFQVVPSSAGSSQEAPQDSIPVLDIQYNEVAYTQDLASAQSLTVFFVFKDARGGTLGTVFVSEDSQRTLASWSVLYSLVEAGFQKLKSFRG